MATMNNTSSTLPAPNTAPGENGFMSQIGEKERFMLLLIAPAAIVLILFQILPIVIGANASFRDWQLFNPAKTWIGFSHYLYILTDPAFLFIVLPNTFLLMFLSVSLSLTCGMALALFLKKDAFEWFDRHLGKSR